MKAYRLIYLLLVMSAGLGQWVFAEEDEVGCIRGDCESGQGTLVTITETGKERYVGMFKSGQYDGFGRLELQGEGSYYKGKFRMGKKHGRGTFSDRENNVYIGYWRDNRRYGYGLQAYHVDGWTEDQHGEGWLKENTENYSGDFQNDVFYGQGTYRWPDGTKYTGAWVGSKKHGEGYFDYGNGNLSHRKYRFDTKVFD